MKTVNFKISVIALAISFMMVSCGGGNKQQQSSTTESTAVETKDNDYANQALWTEMSASDWQKVVKANFDFDLTIPSEWRFEKGEKNGANPSYYVNFITDATDFDATSKVLHQYWFDLTASIVPADGNFNIDMQMVENEKGEVVGRKDVKGERFTELTINKFINSLQPSLWYFNTPKGAVQISLTFSEKAKMAQISLIYMGKKVE